VQAGAKRYAGFFQYGLAEIIIIGQPGFLHGPGDIGPQIKGGVGTDAANPIDAV